MASDFVIFEQVRDAAIEVVREAELAAAGLRWATDDGTGRVRVPTGTSDHVIACRHNIGALADLGRWFDTGPAAGEAD